MRDSLRYSDTVLIIPPELIPVPHVLRWREDGPRASRNAVSRVGRSARRRGGRSDRGCSGRRRDSSKTRISSRLREAASAGIRRVAGAGSGTCRIGLSERCGRTGGGHAPLDGRRCGCGWCRASRGIAAPHVSPEGGFDSYRAAYAPLGSGITGPDVRHSRNFPLRNAGPVWPDAQVLRHAVRRGADGYRRWSTNSRMPRPSAIGMEDYCHSVEHSIEFQVVFLQSIFGPDIRVAPILCGSFFRSIYEGGMPEDDENVRRFLGTLGEIAARRQRTALLGAGRRYGPHGSALRRSFEAHADDG